MKLYIYIYIYIYIHREHQPGSHGRELPELLASIILYISGIIS